MACELDWTQTRSDPEIELRIRPLREQWEARGPGMLAYMARRVRWIELPPRLVIDLVKPGTGGRPDKVSSGRIQVEAFLVNPLPQLPEVVRLAWLCTRTAILESHHDTFVAAALVPAAIQAAEYVELAKFDTTAVALALENWLHDSSSLHAGQLVAWWQEINPRACEDKAVWLQSVQKHVALGNKPRNSPDTRKDSK